MESTSTFRTEAQRRYPTATVWGDGPFGVVMYDGRTHVQMFQTLEEARKFAGGGFRVENFGYFAGDRIGTAQKVTWSQGPNAVPRPFRHRMDPEDD